MSELEDLKQQRTELSKRIEQLERQQERTASQEFIRVNCIGPNDVHLLAECQEKSGGKKYFNTIWHFAKWLECQPPHELRRFVQWNGGLFFTSDLLAGHMKRTPGCVDDVPEA